MNPIFRIALAEVLICSMSCTQFLAPIITYADETLSGTVDTQPIVVTDPVLTVIETTATGDMLTLEIQTGAVIESSESSIQDHTGTLTLPIFDTPVDLQEVREVQGQQIEITPVRSSTASLALPSDDIIVEFKSSSIDVDTIQGEIEIASIEQLQDITVTTTLPEENIVVMNVLSIPSNEGVSFLPSVEYVDTLSHEQKIDATIAALKTDPRVEHVQRNFKYQIQ